MANNAWNTEADDGVAGPDKLRSRRHTLASAFTKARTWFVGREASVSEDVGRDATASAWNVPFGLKPEVFGLVLFLICGLLFLVILAIYQMGIIGKKRPKLFLSGTPPRKHKFIVGRRKRSNS